MRLCVGLLWAGLAMMMGGCASLSKDQCKTVEWGQQGERDAFDGYARERLEEHARACGDYGVRPDRDAYFTGYQQGLLRFCRPQRGFDFGRADHTYRNTCPVELDAAFQNGYRAGKALYAEERTKSGIEYKVREAEKKLKNAAADEERTRLRNELRELDSALIDSNRKLRRLDEDIAKAGLLR